jgi:hypothetical protein
VPIAPLNYLQQKNHHQQRHKERKTFHQVDFSKRGFVVEAGRQDDPFNRWGEWYHVNLHGSAGCGILQMPDE